MEVVTYVNNLLGQARQAALNFWGMITYLVGKISRSNGFFFQGVLDG